MLTVTLYPIAHDDPIPNVWALLETRAQECVMSTDFAKVHSFILNKPVHPYNCYNADGTPNMDGKVLYEAGTPMEFDGHYKTIKF